MTTSPDQTTVERYRDAAVALLPPGHAFTADIGGDLAKLLEALSVEPARLHEEAAALRRNYDPAQAVELLNEWEAALDSPTYLRYYDTPTRQGAVVTKMRGNASHAKRDFERTALSLGYGEETWTPAFRVPVLTPSTFAGVPTDAVLGGRFRFTFMPASSSSFVGTKPLISFGTGNIGQGFMGVYLSGFSGLCALYMVPPEGNASGPYITYSPGQSMLVDVDTVAGTMTVTGATTGNGITEARTAPFRFPVGSLEIGQHSPIGGWVFDGTVSNIETWSPTGIEYVTYSPFVAGLGAAGDVLVGDESANAVTIYVPIDNESVDDDRPLASPTDGAFDQLRRSHGYLDIILEGPMGAERINTPYYYNNSLAADGVVASLGFVRLRYEGNIDIQCVIDNGSGGAPSDSPVGVWELWCSGDGTTFSPYTTSAIVTELAKIAPNGNNVVSAYAVIPGVPGLYVKLRYNQTSGGGTNAKATVNITAW